MAKKATKQNKKKEEFSLAKDKNQAIAGVAVFTIFILKVCHSLYVYFPDAEIEQQLMIKVIIVLLLGALISMLFVMLKPLLGIGLKSKSTKNKMANIKTLQHITQTSTAQANITQAPKLEAANAPKNIPTKSSAQLAKNKTKALLALGVFSAFALKVSHSLYVFALEAEPNMQILAYAGIGLFLFSLVAFSFVLLAPHFMPKKNNVAAGSFGLAKDKNQAILAALIFGAFILKISHSGYVYYQENQAEQANLPITNEMPVDLMKNSEKRFDGLQTTRENISEDEIDIIAVKTRPDSFVSNKVLIPVSDTMASNPFMPFKDEFNPALLPKFDMMAPPEILGENSEAQRVMSTTISGILYDNYSPSAIININGSDYLVKKGDIINNYKVLAISKDQVVVQLGANVYRAGVGQILAQGNINYNTVSNLNKKFGGSPEILVNVRKQTY